MSTRRDLRNDFIRHYLHPSDKGLVLRHKLKRRIGDIATLVIDIQHLTTGKMQVVDSWSLPDTEASPTDSVYRATVKSSNLLMRGLHAACGNAKLTPHMSDGSGLVDYAVWHHGQHHKVYIAGSTARVLQYCDLTENEREEILMQARKFATNSKIVFATAQGVTESKRPTAGSLQFTGLIVCSLDLHKGTFAAMDGIRSKGILPVLMTSEAEDVAMMVAQAARVVTKATGARHAGYAAAHHAIFSNVTKANAPQIIRKLDQDVIVARHSLPEIYDMLAAIWR